MCFLAFHENGVRASMFDREFVSTILGLIGEHCSEVMHTSDIHRCYFV